ncbi:DUF4031 domain-containing protein [Pseudokineococcus sp. 1T1Z-3]|uniref:DUF4031 domain-containing protein n=1 Tax=Pseudokineococcus sp. 1T1Z-3 TaxID=3132745 RepID=UPI0030B223F6
MAVLVDPPRWPAHGRQWSHLVSDTSLEELHAFAAGVGIPRRGFEGDHYDVPGDRLADLLAAGACLVPAGELLRRLVASGLRVPKQRGQQVVASRLELRPDGTQAHVDLVVCSSPPPPGTTRGTRVLALDGEGRLLLRRSGAAGAGTRGPAPAGLCSLPHAPLGMGRPLGFSRLRPCADGGGGRPPASRWRHLALVALAPADAVAAAGEELVLLPATSAARACGAPTWWPLVEACLEAATVRP